MKICIKNCKLISMDPNQEQIINNIDILINNTIIEKIDKNINDECDKIIDATNKIAMPGLINTHSHVPMSIFRETLYGYTLQDWLNKKIWPMEDKLTNDDVYNASKYSFLEMVKTGTTTINDMYFMTEDIIKAQKEIPVRLQTTRTLMNINETESDYRLTELANLIEKYKNNELITFNAGIHGLYTAFGDFLDNSILFSKKYNIPIHMHYKENSGELIDDETNQGYAPSEVLKNKFSNTKLLLAHCVKANDNDIKFMKENNVSVSHCPISNLKLGCGIAPINKFLENGINVSLGTDGQGSGCSLDLFDSMKLAALLQKGVLEDPVVIPSYEVLKMATINGAKALGLDNIIGSIEIGKKADIILLDTTNIKFNPINDIISDIVYNMSGNDVDTTIINGKVLMENKKTDFDEKEIYNNSMNIISKIEV